jgi:hypothetical protein
MNVVSLSLASNSLIREQTVSLWSYQTSPSVRLGLISTNFKLKYKC